MKRMGIKAAPFLEKTTVEFPDGRLFRRLDLAREVFEFDSVINLAKLKTHSQMFLTLAVKNLFGAVIGSDKVAWHLRAGKDYEAFATVLVQILEAVKPRLSIVDGILGMEGRGPSGGSPRHLGIVGASADAVALDASICRLLGFKVEDLRTCVVGESLRIGTTRADQIDVVGDVLHDFPLKDFKPPRLMTVTWNLSAGNPARRFLEKRIATRPRIDSSTCSGCRTCLTHCPPQAISEREGSMVINYEKCISCFCCQELCAERAIDVIEPLLGRMLSRLSR
jgi:Pyruvate/2-oxoacid:ferredoxin oxidoreductase delta subunit